MPNNNKLDDLLNCLRGNKEEFKKIVTNSIELMSKVCDYAKHKAERKGGEPWSVIGSITGHGSGVSSVIYEYYKSVEPSTVNIPEIDGLNDQYSSTELGQQLLHLESMLESYDFPTMNMEIKKIIECSRAQYRLLVDVEKELSYQQDTARTNDVDVVANALQSLRDKLRMII